MPAAIDPIVKQRVIAQYLQGVSRDTIAADNDIGTGTVSNIIDEWKKGVQNSDYESIRELSVFCKKQGVTLNTLASCIRLNNYIQSLGANVNESTLESLITKAGQQDAIYDHDNGLAYNPVAACCHSPDWDNQFENGYSSQWNSYQSSTQTANVNVENSPGAVVNVGQSNEQQQQQGPSIEPVGCGDYGCNNPEPGCGPCNQGFYHHFGWFHHFGFSPFHHWG
jgi:hypothetical protein